MSDKDEDVIHMVPVPQKHLKLVYQTLARAMSEGETKMNSAPTRSGTLPFQNRQGVVWNKDTLRKLRNGLRGLGPLKMLDMTADSPDCRVYFGDVGKELHLPDTTTRAQIGTLTKIIKREFKVEYNDANWPVVVGWDEESKLMYYVMEEETAKAWRSLKEEANRASDQ